MPRFLVALAVTAALLPAAPVAGAQTPPPAQTPANETAAASYFLLRLTPPRPTFPQDMTAAEAAVMRQHVAYWTAAAQRGQVVVFGPVPDPAGAWGVAVIRAPDLTAARALSAQDPAMTAAIGMRTDIFPMPRAMVTAAPAPAQD